MGKISGLSQQIQRLRPTTRKRSETRSNISCPFPGCMPTVRCEAGVWDTFSQDILYSLPQGLAHHGPHIFDTMTLNQTPPPNPNWDRHLSAESRLELALREGRPTVIQQRDTGDEADDGLEVME